MFRLTPRLQQVADEVSSGAVFADIGTDHAHIPIYLIEKGICFRGYACDVRTGPLSRARQNIIKSGLDDHIQTVLTDGLSDLPLSEIGEIIIAGMGGELITRILDTSKSCIPLGQRYVLQPMTDLPMLRLYLFENCFQIYHEKLASEKGKLYHIIAAVKTASPAPFDRRDVVVGKISRSDPYYSAYLEKSIKKYRRILSGLQKSSLIETMDAQKQALSDLLLFESEVE